MASADADGDGASDVFVRVGRGDGSPDAIYAIFGQIDSALAPPRKLGTFGAPTSVYAGVTPWGQTNTPDPNQVESGTGVDVLVTTSDANASSAGVAQFEGQPNRDMQAMIRLLRNPVSGPGVGDTIVDPDIPNLWTLGKFVPGSGGALDLAVFASTVADDKTNYVLWKVPAPLGPSSFPLAKAQVTSIDDQFDHVDDEFVTFIGAADVDAEPSRDEVILTITRDTITPDGETKVIAFRSGDDQGWEVASVAVVSGSAIAPVGSAFILADQRANVCLADVDGDGRKDFVALLDSANTTSLTVLWNDGGGFSVDDASTIPINSDTAPLGISCMSLDTDPALEVVVPGIPVSYRFDFAAKTRTFTVAKLPELSTAVAVDSLFETGDVNGDGLDDLVALDTKAGITRALFAIPTIQ
jgi:hypothetical protein